MATDNEIDSEGHLELKRDPEAWIRINRASRRAMVTSFDMEKIGESIGKLVSLTHLEISYCWKIKYLPDSIANLSSLTSLSLKYCDSLVQLPTNIGQLVSLTHLKLSFCYKIKYLPDTIADLSNLTFLSLEHCHSLVKLPANIGKLVSLTHLKLSFCYNIKYLPDSIADLSSLISLSLSSCISLVELPENVGLLVSLTHLQLCSCWKIKYLPDSIANLSSLTSLSLKYCDSLVKLPASIGQLVSLTHLKISFCYGIKYLPNSIANLSNLTSLSVEFWNSLVELPPNLDGLAHLCLVDIEKTGIRCLPWSIMKLRKLRHLMLPENFRLQTLPDKLNNSVIISVRDWHFRKSWEELKKEMGKLPNPVVEEIPNDSSIISPPGYLRLEGDPLQWIINNTNLLKLVRFLDLRYLEKLTYSITQFSELTHLYLDNTVDICLPDTYFVMLTRLTHLSLQFVEVDIDDMSFIHSLSKLSNLESLHLSFIHGSDLPANFNMPVRLKHLSLSSCDIRLLYDGLEKLTDLKTLDLHFCHNCVSLPPNICTAKLRLVGCSFQSLPIGLRYLEILCFGADKPNYIFEICWNQLVNLETLSITSKYMKQLSEEIARLRNLQILQLKDCDSLEKLPSNLHELVDLHTLDISITRIKSLPPSFVKLHNLQHLILPKCFNLESLPTNLKQVYIIDDTENAYYEHMHYDASLYQTYTSDESENKETEQGVVPGESCNAGNDNVQTMRINEFVLAEQTSADQITSEQGGVSHIFRDFRTNEQRIRENEHNQTLQNDIKVMNREDMIMDEAAAAIRVSKATMKDLKFNRLKRRNEKQQQLPDAKKRKQNNKAPFGSDCSQQNLVNPKNSAAYTKTVSSNFNVNNATLATKDGANELTLSNTLQQNENLSDFVVKATYKEDIIKFKFSLSCSIDQLKEEVANQLELEANTFKIKYQDEDKNWILVNNICILEDALKFSRSNNSSVVRLFIVPKI